MNVNVLVSTVRKGFQDTTLTDCDLGKEEEFRPLKGELKHDLQLSSKKNKDIDQTDLHVSNSINLS